MTQAEKLEALVRKAIEGGWSDNPPLHHYPAYLPWDRKIIDTSCEANDERSAFDFLFNHDFAKALWGETSDTLTVQNNSLNIKQVIDMDGWRYHLQQAVVNENPIDYMYEVIPKNGS